MKQISNIGRYLYTCGSEGVTCVLIENTWTQKDNTDLKSWLGKDPNKHWIKWEMKASDTILALLFWLVIATAFVTFHVLPLCQLHITEPS